jgi:transcriptional regulator with PAS, ATPase and Fis domain
VWQARDAHRKACEYTSTSYQFRDQRDQLIRKLYDTHDYSYTQLAKQIGCSRELIAKVVQRRADV